MRDLSIILNSSFCSILLYLLIGFDLDRSDTNLLIFSFSGLFLTFILIMFQDISIRSIFLIGIIFRLILLFSIPNLSQDFYRFIWDGNLQLIGLNPYLYSPNQLFNSDYLFYLASDLFQGMGSISNENYSNYPPVSQFVYFISAYFGKNNLFFSIIILKIIIIFSDIGIFYFLCKLFNLLKLPIKRVGFYFLNPLIIIELTGNLHGEGIMLFFFLAGIYMLIKNRFFTSSLLFSISVATKLITLMLIPSIIKRNKKNNLKFYISFILFFIVLWIPFLEKNLYLNYISTLMLWFNKFEFNASIYYLIREVGFYIKGYNIIQEYSIVSILILISVIIYFSFFKENKSIKDILTSQLFILSLYFFISTTVHPWYLISLVTICLFTPYFYPILWSGLIFLSYTSYGSEGFEEKPLMIIIEYLLVFSFFIFEIKGNRNMIFNAFVKNLSLSK